MISFKSKKGLGRGLSSLIGEGKVSSSTKAKISELESLTEIQTVNQLEV